MHAVATRRHERACHTLGSVHLEHYVTVKDSTHSTLREHIVEHVFVGELLRKLWRRDVTDVEVLRPEFDAHGYALVLTCGSVARHMLLNTDKSKAPEDARS